MAALKKDDILSFFTFPWAKKPMITSHDVAVHAYSHTKGPTPDLRRVYQTYLASKAISPKHGKSGN